MTKTALLQRTLYLFFLIALVYLGFRFLLPLVFPFLLAYLTFRLLYPTMLHIQRDWHLPRVLSHYGTLLLFFAGSITALLLFFWKVMGQVRLLFTNFPIYKQIWEQNLLRHSTNLCHCIDNYLGLSTGTTNTFIETQYENITNSCADLFSRQSGKTLLTCLSSSLHFFMVCGFFIVSMIILVKEMEPLQKWFRNSRYYPPMHKILSSLKKSGFTYLRTEGLILIINWFVCSFSLFLIKNPYFFLLGTLIALLDALPVIGSGLFLVPWGIYALFCQEYYQGIVLLLAYLITLFAREIMEARLLGKGMGLNPFLTLISIFVGVELFGATGIFLGPIGAVLVRALME